jgi:predicted RNA-binding Zn-ribbon protein involved in translation (DUF1610 family)
MTTTGDDQAHSEGSTMSSVMIRCPTTGRAVSTAVETERTVFNKLPNVTARMRCPACGQEHIWTVKSAWLAEMPHPLDETPVLTPPDSEAA